MQDHELLLQEMHPADRLKYIRQKIIKQNQNEFCADGIIRIGTLKAIESKKLMIADKIAERISHKLELLGIICDYRLFVDQAHKCNMKIDHFKKNLTGDASLSLEIIKQKLARLTPIKITSKKQEPYIPNGATILVRELAKSDIINLNCTLCLIQGINSEVYFLSYSQKSIVAQMHDVKKFFTNDFLDFCKIFVIELIYFGERL